MTRTELLSNLIKDHLSHNRTMDVETFREIFVNGLPSKLALLAISRNGERVLPIFDVQHYVTDEMVDYTSIRRELGDEWMPLVSAHVWNRLPGYVPQTLLAIDGIVDERVLTRVFGNRVNWNHNLLGMVTAFNFGDFDLNTLPRLAVYSVDHEGARRIRIGAEIDEGRVFGLHLDGNGRVRYLDRQTGRTMYAVLQVGRDSLIWDNFPLKD